MSNPATSNQQPATSIIGIIPARYRSSRFPGKPLADIKGKSMLQRVYEQSIKSKSLLQVIVATDHKEIYDHAKDFGGEVMMTDIHHQSGTERCNEVAQKIKLDDEDIVINIQGDEPFIHPGQIDLVAACFNAATTQIATLIKKIGSVEELLKVSIPKVVINKNKEAIYFSRASIPFLSNEQTSEWLNHHTYYKHIGIYGYRVKTLHLIAKLPASPLEKAESLEQLRWIENGYRIKTAVTSKESYAIDMPEDIKYS